MRELFYEISKELGSEIEPNFVEDNVAYIRCPICRQEGLKIWHHEQKFRAKCTKNNCKATSLIKLVNSALVDISQKLRTDSDEKDIGESSVSLDKLNTMAFIPRRQIISNLLLEGSIVLIAGDAGSGKSWIVHSIITHIIDPSAVGKKIGNWKVLDNCGVLLVDGEMPLQDIQMRFKLLQQGANLNSEGLPLIIWSSIENETDKLKSINIADPKTQDKVLHFFKNNPTYKVLVLDNLSSLSIDVNENVKGDYDGINRWTLQLRGLGVTTILVHHFNKAGEDRGHSSRRDNVDTIVYLKDVSDTKDEVCVEFIFKKCRHLKPGEGNTVTLSLEGDDSSGLYFTA